MKKLIFLILFLFIFSGRSYATTYTVDDDGGYD